MYRSRTKFSPSRCNRLFTLRFATIRRLKPRNRLSNTRSSNGTRKTSHQSRSRSLNFITLVHFFILCLVYTCKGAEAKRATGVTQLSSSTSPVFLSNFAVGPDGARFEWSADAIKPTTIGLYDQKTWDKIQKEEEPSTCGCECYASQLLPGMSFSFDGGSASNATNFAFPLGTPGYIVIAALSCGDDVTDTLSWSIHLTLSAGLFKEIPWNSQGLLECYSMSVSTACVLLLTLVISHEWWKGKRWYLSPPPTKMFMVSVFTWVAGSACILTHLVIYSQNGVGSLVMEGFGRVVQVIGRLVFIATLLMMARGFAIHFSKFPPVCAPIKQVSKTRSTEGACIAYFVILALATCYVVLGISYVVDRSPDNVAYVYDSVTGLVECGTQVLAGVWFVLEVWRTHEREYREQHREWLFNYGALNLLYFLILPVIVLVAMFEFESYEDEKIVEITMQASTAFFYTALLINTMLPRKADFVFSRWEPDVNVVKLMRPEIGSVDLLTPVLSGYSTPTLPPYSSSSSSGNKRRSGNMSRGGGTLPGYGTISSNSNSILSQENDAASAASNSSSNAPLRRLKPTAASAQGRSKLSKIKKNTTFENNSGTSPKEANIIQMSENQPSLMLPMLLGAMDMSSTSNTREVIDNNTPLLSHESNENVIEKMNHVHQDDTLDEQLDTGNATDMLRNVLQSNFLETGGSSSSRFRQGSVRLSFGRKESFTRKDSISSGRRFSSLKGGSERPRLSSVLDGLEEERESIHTLNREDDR